MELALLAAASAGTGAAVAGTGAGLAASTAAAMSVGGTLLSMGGQMAAGDAARDAARFEAAQIDRQATAERATASMEAAEEARQARLIQSRARAVGGASGGGIDYDLMGDLEQEGAYRRGIAIWSGEERARGLQGQAAATRFDGDQRKSASRVRAAGTLLGGAATMFDKYG